MGTAAGATACSEAAGAAAATADEWAAADELPASFAFSEAANDAPMENLELSAEAKPERPPVELFKPDAECATGVEGLPETPCSAAGATGVGAVLALLPALLSRLLRADAHELTLDDESWTGRGASTGTKGGIEGAECVKGTAFEAFLSFTSMVEDAGLGAAPPRRKERFSSGAEGKERGGGAAQAAGVPQSEGLVCDAVDCDCAAAMG